MSPALHMGLRPPGERAQIRPHACYTAEQFPFFLAITAPMTLAAEDIQFIKDHLGEWLAEQSLGRPPAVYEVELHERMVRVEEELRHQRELIKTILVEMDKRFDAVDKHFKAMQQDMDLRFDAMEKRFEAIDKRFEATQQDMDRRFNAMEKHFEAVDKRFETIDKRFETIDKRFEELTRRIDRFMFWSFGLTLSVGALIVAALKLWP
jgi:chaperonin cofactor prefoldin